MTLDLTTLAWRKNPDGFLPAIIQDANVGRVLMLGYMNQEALIQTQMTGFVTFYSRSKKRLWKKGETSGNTLSFVSASSDCDGDALLIRAIPTGPTCHTGEQSCFSMEESALETLGNLAETIRQRAENSSEGSYTRLLLKGGIGAYGAKVLEEAEEVVRAARDEGKQRTIEEAADVLYHLFVLLRGQGIELNEVAEELRDRRK
ncbi:MAG: bifunctional phosphoribosyl-AMP cyclohydrolase/phosphoribosyl-ATP diphosphatase HisIE [Candidatus Peribacteraceae bacterium]|nr:bifunctional phosphoribosyl-AMP cyclohydrolase/phosphoribosyl-ATP diphosphatase HisIE [Candidatus Peribacteraceae bacterium]MDD5742078.1 bifunctional phosphoribosyl-AMP cyclohydrolase/phosphoribosyl-ATP diphosphatase HisIE [Candidatus Peribacteraceae bacterium]